MEMSGGLLIASLDARLECPRLWKKVILIEGFSKESVKQGETNRLCGGKERDARK